MPFDAPLAASCLRGLAKKDHRTERPRVAPKAFLPDPRTARTREDGGEETSINWEDDDGALAQLRSGNQAHNGVARLERRWIENVAASFGAPGVLFAERRRAEGSDNPYHGNIVFCGLTMLEKNHLAACLALYAKLVE